MAKGFMLSISTAASASSAGRYFTSLSREDYYLNGGEPMGQWFGAEWLGLSGVVTAKDMKKLMQGIAPDGTKLVQNSDDPKRRAGWDLTFSAPKSVSVLWSASEAAVRERIEWCHEWAVRETMRVGGELAGFTRRGKGSLGLERIQFTYAAFQHGTSRALDAQLHSHCFVFNVCRRTDGTTGTITPEEIFRHKMVLGALYRAHLAHLLTQYLNVTLEAEKKWFRVAGVPQSLIDEHSKRRREVELVLKEYGESGPVAAEKAALASRKTKELVPREELFRRWGALAEEHGFRPGWELLLETPRTVKGAEILPDKLVESLLSQESYFSERQVLRAMAEQAQTGGYDIGLLRQAARVIVGVNVPVGVLKGERQYTTKEILELEKKLMEQAKRGQNTGRHRVPKFIANFILKDTTLSKEQEQAVRDITTGKGSIRVVQGLAGTGKSVMLDTARQIWQAGGRSVIGVALAGKAADGLEKASGIRSMTVESFLKCFEDRNRKEVLKDFKWGSEPLKLHGVIQQGRFRSAFGGRPTLHRRSVIVVDEAGMLGTPTLKKLLDLAQSAGAKVVLVGDRKQLPAIERGGPFGWLADTLGCSTLTDIRRQEEPWAREVVKDLAEGNIGKALGAMDERKLVTVAETTDAVRSKLIADWSKERGSLILAGTREEVEDLNNRAQQERKNQRLLGNKHVSIGKEKFHVGDRVIFKENSSALDVRNGFFGRVVKVRRGLFSKIEIQLDGAPKGTEPVVVHPSKYPHLRLAYALSVHAAQGVTVNAACVLFSAFMQGREMSYVQMSRSRGDTRLYLTKEQAGEYLTNATRTMSRSNAKFMAHEVTEGKTQNTSKPQSHSHAHHHSHSHSR